MSLHYGHSTSADLCETIENGTATDVWNILANDVNPNIGRDMQTPLHIAAILGQSEMVYRLLLYDADVSLLDKDGFTARDRALQFGYLDIVQLLDYYALS